ncbi:unnamed protein product [Larinioides sclopetarius]|uniref:Acetyl-CoA hydrolase n=1 Tax=Larinioides sclopetarius TaxID=280406 RepID=A0AAV2B2N8_9ARAC
MAARCYLAPRLSRKVLNFFNNRSLAKNCSRKFTSVLRVPAQPLLNKPAKWMSAEEAVSVVKSGDTVFVQGTSGTPRALVPALAEYGKKSNLKNVTVCHIYTGGAAEYTHPDCAGIFRCNSFFSGADCREAINSGRADFVPIALSEIPLLFRRKLVPLDVALVQVTPADAHGYCSLGSSVECTPAALQHAKYIIGQVNPRMPRTFGDAAIHVSHFDALVEGEMELPELKPDVQTEVELSIGKQIAENLVVDGATLQMGIGSIPDAVLAALKNHRDLGIHSEMLSDGLVDLVNTGAINNRFKANYRGKITGTFAMGTRKLFDFMDENPFVVMLSADYVNHSDNIATQPKMTAINSCIEVDLTGQVCSDSIGTKIYSGVGGQTDFLRAAAMAYDGLGKPILAMPSCTGKGESKIVPFIKQGEFL